MMQIFLGEFLWRNLRNKNLLNKFSGAFHEVICGANILEKDERNFPKYNFNSSEARIFIRVAARLKIKKGNTL